MLVVDALRMDAPRIHVGASGILYEENKVLMGKRAADDEALPGLWCTPGGGVELYETFQEAIMREFLEETGIDVVVNNPIFVGQSISEEKKKHTILHFYRVSRACFRLPEALEGFSEIKWWSWGEIWQSEELITNLTFAALSNYFHKVVYKNSNV